ncbi:MAG: helix-turn-helix domain-containing protein [Methylococcaceae bacterium]
MQKPITSQFDLNDLPRHERFAVWKESISVLFEVSLNDKEAAGEFTSQLTTCHMASILFANSSSKAQQFQRTRQKIARDGLDHVLVQVYRKGCNVGVCGKTNLNVRPGDLMFLDLGQTVDTRTDDYDNLTLVIPRQTLEPYCPDPGFLHGQVLSGQSVSGHLLRTHIEYLWNNLPTVTMQEVPAIVTGLATLVSVYFGALPAPEHLPEIQSNKLEAIKDYISNHLANPDLTPDKLAARFFMSRASLYRLFTREGGLAAYIRQERLDRALRLLGHPAHKHRYISDIAASVGFYDDAHFSRLFHRTFGITPSDARQTFLMDESLAIMGESGSLDRSYEKWLKYL